MSTSYKVHVHDQRRVAVLTIDNPPVNSLSQTVRSSLLECIHKAQNDRQIAAIILRGANGCFSAGAEISEFKSKGVGPDLESGIIQTLETSSKPVVACIERFALGGGLELALGAHFRVSSPSAKLGLPEVNLGLLPGAGGTQRLPRLVGAEAAVELMITGRPIHGRKAASIGLVDKCASNAFEECLSLAVTNVPPPPTACGFESVNVVGLQFAA